jgi:hypothetical protein
MNLGGLPALILAIFFRITLDMDIDNNPHPQVSRHSKCGQPKEAAKTGSAHNVSV